MNSTRFHDYLQPTTLCNFNKEPEIERVARSLTCGINEANDKIEAIAEFAKEIEYCYEGWYIKASETLSCKTGMCSSKTNLFIALSRSIGIPARYRLFRTKPESELFKWLNEQDSRIEWSNFVQYQDHVVAEAFINENWQVYDMCRDAPYELGMIKLRIPLEIHRTSEILLLSSFDEWAYKREQKRRLRGDNDKVLFLANEQIEKIRRLGKDSKQKM
jgi:transglutaminase-like putative cysteine protease